jgi:predicted O-methyltransferase YrrM
MAMSARRHSKKNPMSNLQAKIAAIVPTITGWCTPEKAQDLALAIIKSRSSVTVEIGVWGGRSAIPMALAHTEQKHGIVWAIDPWSPQASTEGYDTVNANWWGSQNHEAVYQGFLLSLKAAGVEQYVKVIRQKSDDVEPPEKIDVLHIDGQHTDQAVKDVERFASRVVPSGFVFVDDIQWSGGGVGRAVERLLAMGFVKVFDRDTGAMFQRQEKPAPVKRGPYKKKRRKKKRECSE